MNFGRDTRGVSEVIGAVLIFGLMVMLLAILQTALVPTANEKVEFNHHDSVQSQLVDFHQVSASTARNGDADSTKLKMGVRYPSRMLFFNPPPAAGSLSTSDEGAVTIENVQAEDPTVAKYVNNGPIEVGTRSLMYRPNYNEYRNAPVSRYEYGVLYNDHESSQLLVNDGGVIQGREISLLMPAGELHESSTRAVSIDPRPVSAPAKTVAITGDGSGEDITLTLPSEMNATLWTEAIDMSHVQGIEDNDNGTVTIALDPNETYSLRMARIGVGGNTSAQTPKYLFSPRGTQFDIPQSQSRGLDIEVRDQYNNPVPHVDVQARISDGEGSIDDETSSGSDGVARPRFEAPSEPQRVTVDVTLDDSFNNNFDPDTDPRDLQLDVWVTSYAGGLGDNPSVSASVEDSACGTDDLGDWLDNPVGSTFGEGDGNFVVDWNASSNDEYGIQSVELQLTRNDNGQIVDTERYTFDGEDDTGDVTGLVDEGTCGDSYDISVTAETTGGATASDVLEDRSL